jgi:preprotein translocase subunit YajC
MTQYVYDNKINKVVDQLDSAAILLGKNRQKNKKGEIENIRANDRIVLAAGINSIYDDTRDKLVTEVLPAETAAGIIINQSASPSYIFNVGREDNGLVLNPPNNKNYEQLKETEKGIGTVTVFGDEIQLVSFKNGVNIYTGRRGEKGMMDVGSGVSLIHGNDAESLEPMVKGKKLEEYLNQTNQNTTNLQNLIFLNGWKISALYALMAGHDHIVPQIPAGVTIAVGSIMGIIANIGEKPLTIKDTIDNVITAINKAVLEINATIAFKSSPRSSFHYLN